MATRDKAKSLNELAGIPEYDVFTTAEKREFRDKITKKYGGFDRNHINKFYEENEFARIIWSMKVKGQDEPEPLPMGKVAAVYPRDDMSGKKIWKDYVCKTNPFTFYEELYRQTNLWMAGLENGDRQNLKMFDKMAQLEESSRVTHE